MTVTVKISDRRIAARLRCGFTAKGTESVIKAMSERLRAVADIAVSAVGAKVFRITADGAGNLLL